MAAYLFCSAIFLSLNYSNAPVGDFDISMSKMCLEKFNHIYVYHKYALRSSSDKPLSGYSVDEVPPEIIRVEVAVSISNFGVSLLLVLKSPSSLHSSILLHRKRINTRLYSRLYLFCKKKKKKFAKSASIIHNAQIVSIHLKRGISLMSYYILKFLKVALHMILFLIYSIPMRNEI